MSFIPSGHSDVVMIAAILPSSSTPDSPLPPKCPQHHPDRWLAQRGPQTLAVWMKVHGLNALRIASFLTLHPAVKLIIYPGLAAHPLHALTHTSLSPHSAVFQHPTAVDPCARYTVLRDVSFHVHGAKSAKAFLHIETEALRIFWEFGWRRVACADDACQSPTCRAQGIGY